MWSPFYVCVKNLNNLFFGKIEVHTFMENFKPLESTTRNQQILFNPFVQFHLSIA